MAIDSETARLFLAGKQAGINLGRMVMLGRQNFLLRPAETRSLFQSFGLTPDPRLLVPTPPGSNPPFSEPFFESLGATACEAMDVSSYEGASIIHDMNEPLPPHLYDQFDLVFDGGTLEHVFQFPQALHNAMQLVKPGGWFVGFTPGNNWFGHGFYQFSPEVYYRALSRQNGFSKCAVFTVPEGLGLRWYLVRDPVQLHNRTNLINSLRTPLLVLGQKVAPTPAKLQLQQSDYLPYWSENTQGLNTGKVRKEASFVLSLKDKLYQWMPVFTRRLATLEARRWCHEYTIGKRDVFVPIDKARLASVIAGLPANG
jgi:SAM-dependent methyltransferase